ncbi:MAG TPA: histidine phosphatase family protein [Allosphingosinicella sp.]|jgi:phosphohistidine phosphatase|nr:histidine phosphatase family protein [Allosphingosinicella sp.]
MKTLTLLRHAKSGWDAPVRDFDRPLSPRGRKAARAMGREMKRLGLDFDFVLASPAARVTETLTELAQGYGGAVATDFDEHIYLASAETLLEIVRAADDAHERLLIAGHNPGMEQLALLLAEGGALRDRIAAKYPTGALAELRFDGPGWRDVAAGAGRLERFIRPRDLDPQLGPEG